MTAVALAEPSDGALVAFGPLTEVYAVYQRCTAQAGEAGYPDGVHWFQPGDDSGEPLSWVDLQRSHERDAGPHLLATRVELAEQIRAEFAKVAVRAEAQAGVTAGTADAHKFALGIEWAARIAEGTP